MRRFQVATSRLLFCIAVAAMHTVWASERVQRTMIIHRVAELGLEIWTEEDPKWDTQLTQKTAKQAAIFSAETPNSHYPPAGMTWAVPGLTFKESEFREAARGAAHQAARNYGLRPSELNALELKPAAYGDLRGYEAEFSAIADTVPVDVKVFFGHQPGKPAVVMQAFTLKGKLPHISEQIRRSWTNVRYLKN